MAWGWLVWWSESVCEPMAILNRLSERQDNKRYKRLQRLVVLVKMRMQIYNIPERKQKSSLTFYLMAVLGGVLVFFLLLGIFKGGSFLIKIVFRFVIDYWMFLLGGIAAALILRRVLFRRRIKRDVMYQSEM